MLRSAVGRALAVCLVVVSVAPVVASTPAVAAPRAPRFGSVIEDYAPYTEPTRCRPRPKPGVQAFADVLQHAYPDTSSIGISRACHGEPSSDHQEGRALDWGRRANVASERRDVKDLLGWLFARDRWGNRDAMLRRLGIDYVIWNRRIWGTWTKAWETYCVQRPAGCRDPETRSILDPHTSHLHISFAWPGARGETTYWNPARSKA
jgi:hypothetical protein